MAILTEQSTKFLVDIFLGYLGGDKAVGLASFSHEIDDGASATLNVEFRILQRPKFRRLGSAYAAVLEILMDARETSAVNRARVYNALANYFAKRADELEKTFTADDMRQASKDVDGLIDPDMAMVGRAREGG